MAPHKSPMTIYFRSQNSLSCRFTPKRASKSKKVIFSNCNVPKCVLCTVLCIYFILLHIIDYNGTTQTPHDNLFQKSGQLGLANLLPTEPQKPKSDILLRQRNRMHSICVIRDKFYLFKCQLFQWHHIKVPWPFISEVSTACSASLLPKELQNPKKWSCVASM